MQAYNKVLKKIIVGFLAVYLIMMGVFTFYKQLDVRREYRNYTYTVLNRLRDNIKRVIEEFEDEEDIIRELNLRSTIAVALTKEFQIYASAGVFKDGECIAKSGNYLENNGMDNQLEYIPGGEKYIDLEKCFSPEELEQFVKKLGDEEKNKEILDRIEIEGYCKGSEVMPETLRYYTIEKRPGEDAWFDEDAVLEQVYSFAVEDKEQLQPYEGDFWLFNGVIQNRVLKDYNLTMNRQARLQKLEESMLEWGKKDGWDWQEGIFENTYGTYQSIETTKGGYGLAFTLQFNPWSVAIDQLRLVYIFSGIVVGLMMLILTRGIGHIYKKQELLEKNRRAFIDAVAHELKTPLAMIQAYSEGLKERIAEEKREAYLEVIIDETAKMNELILEMLKLTKLEDGAYILKLETFFMKKLIEEVVQAKGRLIEDKQITIVMKIDEESEVTADYRCMEQVVSNLLLNAIQHTDIGGTIWISLVEGKVEIENKGAPIPEDKLKLIWNAFYKVEEINNRSGEGSGLGLSIVKNMLELHKLSFGVENTEEGVKFWFNLKRG